MRALSILLLAMLVSGCVAPRARKAAARDLNAIAESYVKLVLAVGEHDEGYVDAYYGPPEWREAIKAQPKRSLEQLAAEGQALIDEIGWIAPGTDPVTLRKQYLARQLESLVVYVQRLGGAKLSFDEESKALYDAVQPPVALESLQPALDALDKLLPGSGSLYDRYQAYRKRFQVPKERLDGVFKAAIAECRRRTLQHIPLPPDESFTAEYVTGKPWGGYNWYQGNDRSVIQVNTDLPAYIDGAIGLACHEGYPGHHVYNVLLEQTLVKGRGWVEFTVYPLYSPQSLIAEGSANYGVDLAFPKDSRIAFERDVLFPLAGLDPNGAEAFGRVEEAKKKLRGADVEISRRYLDGKIDREQAKQLLVKYVLMAPEHAAKRLDFIDHYRSYVINYSLGQELVKAYVERTGGPMNDDRWKVFAELLASPKLPSALVEQP